MNKLNCAVFEQTCRLKRKLISLIDENTTFVLIVFVDVSAIAAAFVGTTVRQALLRWTISSYRYVEVGKTPCFGLSTCLIRS